MKGLALRRLARRGVRELLALSALSLPLALPAHATTFTDGEFLTWSQVAWGGDPFCDPTVCNISGILENDFNSLFAPSDLLEVGVPGAGGFSMIFDSADAIIAYLPASGAPGPLTANLLDPVHTASGALGGEVLTATLNVTFSEDGLLAHPSGASFGDLVLQNLGSLPDDPVWGKWLRLGDCGTRRPVGGRSPRRRQRHTRRRREPFHAGRDFQASQRHRHVLQRRAGFRIRHGISRASGRVYGSRADDLGNDADRLFGSRIRWLALVTWTAERRPLKPRGQ